MVVAQGSEITRAYTGNRKLRPQLIVVNLVMVTLVWVFIEYGYVSGKRVFV